MSDDDKTGRADFERYASRETRELLDAPERSRTKQSSSEAPAAHEAVGASAKDTLEMAAFWLWHFYVAIGNPHVGLGDDLWDEIDVRYGGTESRLVRQYVAEHQAEICDVALRVREEQNLSPALMDWASEAVPDAQVFVMDAVSRKRS